jgi:hypothetical protein
MLARLPGGGLEIEPSQPPRLPPVNETPPPTATGDPNEPRLLLDGRGDELSPAPLPAVHAEDAALVNPASANIDGHKPSIPANDAPRDNRAGNADIADAPAPAPLAELVPRANLLGPATPREMSLVRLLRSEPSIITVEAEQQLLAIGYGEREISLAYSITHPDVDFRLRLVDALPRTDGIRPRRWLEMLLDDDDPQVRLAAMTQLATSGDAALVESLRRRAIADPDPSVRRYAERLRISRSR